MVRIPHCASVSASENGPNSGDGQPPKRRKAGAQLGNKNRIRHGLMACALPDGCTGVRKSITQFRQALEKLLIEDREQVSIYDAALVNEAVRWEQHSLLATRWLRLHAADMDHGERLSYSREIARGASERNKALRELGINRRAIDGLKDGGAGSAFRNGNIHLPDLPDLSEPPPEPAPPCPDATPNHPPSPPLPPA